MILTRDALAMELDKAVQEKVQLVRTVLAERAGRRPGLRVVPLHATIGLVERWVPSAVDRALFRAGVGLEPPLIAVTVSFI